MIEHMGLADTAADDQPRTERWGPRCLQHPRIAGFTPTYAES